MGKGKRRKKESGKKLQRRSAQYLLGGGESNYARKRKYCHKHGVWGFMVPEPKPWKKAKESI